MSQPHHSFPFTRRQLLTRIGALAGSVALYQAMTTMGHAAGTDFTHPPSLTGAKREPEFWFSGRAWRVCYRRMNCARLDMMFRFWSFRTAVVAVISACVRAIP